MSTKSLKTATFLPEEIIHVILLRLPVKYLLRFRAVCKSWKSIISASTFIHTHLQLNCRDRQLLLLQASPSRTTSRESFSLHRDNPSFDEYTKLRNPFLAYDKIQEQVAVSKRKYIALGTKSIDIVGTCNGLVCLVAQDLTVLIWNPSIRKFVVLAKPSVTLIGSDNLSVNYAFGHDSCTDDYKVLRSVTYRGARASCEVDIWSLARGSWKSLTASIDIPGDDSYYPKAFLLEPYAFVNGALHWFHKFKKTNYNDSIVSFDISSESFGEITMPEFWGKKDISLISRYRDYSLAFSENEFTFTGGFRLTLWVMKEYGVGDSCTRIFTIHFQDTLTEPLWFRNSGDVVFDLYNGLLISVDCKTKYTTKFRISKYVVYHFMDYFVESLVLLDKPNAISY